MMNRSVTRCLLGEGGWRGRITSWISHSHFSKMLPQTLTPSREIMSNELLPRAALSCSAITGQSERPPTSRFCQLSMVAQTAGKGEPGVFQQMPHLRFSFLKSATSCPFAKKTHRSKWVLWAGAVSTSSTLPAVGALGQVCREKASTWGLEKTCRA